MKPRHKRLALIVGGVALLALAAGLVLSAFRDNLVFFYTPTDVAAHKAPAGRPFRIGGLVLDGSLKRDGIKVGFVVTDTVSNLTVEYQGILPDLFRQGKGVVAQGALDPDGVFHATEVLAKHDENYMPPEAGHALEQAKKAQATLAK
jgi:cytochrome c-type biogenesis protein CcmE